MTRRLRHENVDVSEVRQGEPHLYTQMPSLRDVERHEMKGLLFSFVAASAIVLLVSMTPASESSAPEPHEPRAALKLNQRICFEPCSLSIRAQIAPMAENRVASVGAIDESGALAQGSTWVLEGEREPKTTWLQPWIMNAGKYMIRLTVYGLEARIVGQASQFIEVRSRIEQDPTSWPNWKVHRGVS